MVEEIYKRRENENEEQYLWRIGEAKSSGEIDIDWGGIADLMNEQFRADDSEYRNESAYRKPYQQAKRFFDAGVFKDNSDESKYAEEIRNTQIELKKLKQKISDERVDYQRSIREQARKESFCELVGRVMARYVDKYDYVPSPEIESDDDMIVCLSDIHAGIEVRNMFNTYNTSIMQQRLHNYLDKIKAAQATHKCKRCELVLAGDNISGAIHPNLRLENNENVIEQIKIAAIAIGEFIRNLQNDFESIRVHSVSGNHSRLFPNKEEHMRGEELDSLIPFCLSLMFDNGSNVEICEDGYIDTSINSFVTRGGKLFYVVHGDKDSPSNVAERLTLMTGLKPDGIIMAHRHHNAYDTQYNTKIIQTGCVVGTDGHCVDLRISGSPEQTVVITNATDTIKCIYDVCLNA